MTRTDRRRLRAGRLGRRRTGDRARSSWAPGRSCTRDLLPAEALPTGPEDVEAAAAAWRTSLDRPGDARNRVLVALERNRVVGFVITGPAGDPDCDPVADAELAS